MFFEIKSDRELILSGLGIQKEEYIDFINNYYMDYNIAGLADCELKREGAYVRGYTIVDTEDWEKLDGMLVLFGDDWYERAEDLRKKGYVLLRDYIPEWYFEFGYKSTCISLTRLIEKVGLRSLEKYIDYINYSKPIAMVIGGIQIPDIVKVLSREQVFTSEYVLLSVLPVDKQKKNRFAIPQYILEKIRILFIQNVKEMTDIYSYNCFISKIRPSCKVVRIPEYRIYDFFDAYISHGDYIYSRSEAIETLNKNIKYFEITEENADISCIDFIKKEFINQRLFEDDCKLTLPMLIVVVTKALEYLGYNRHNIRKEGIDFGEYDRRHVDKYISQLLKIKWE